MTKRSTPALEGLPARGDLGKYLDLSPLLPWRHLPRPVDWDQLFQRPGPLVLEIGTGNGEYAIRQSEAHPEWNLVGLDLCWGSVRRALRRISQTGRKNIRLMLVDAKIALEWLFAPESLEHCYALFPCPWPKRAHAHMRLFSQPFLACVASRLKPGGSLMVVTDHPVLRDFILGNLEGTGFTGELRVLPTRYDTKYERRWQEMGQTDFYEIHLTRNQPTTAPPNREVTLYTHYAPELHPERFHPQPLRGHLTIDFKRTLFDPKERVAMVLAAVVEDNLSQNFWIQIREVPLEGGSGHRWSISPAPGGGVLPTSGIQKSLDLVYEAAVASAQCPSV